MLATRIFKVHPNSMTGQTRLEGEPVNLPHPDQYGSLQVGSLSLIGKKIDGWARHKPMFHFMDRQVENVRVGPKKVTRAVPELVK
jgi:hypothetical protein